MSYKTTIYWACRAMVPDWGYEPVSDGKVFGFACCLPEVSKKVCAKRREDYIERSISQPDKLPIWC